MKDYNFILCIILLPIALSLFKAHNWFMRDADSILPSETLQIMALSLKQKAIIYLVLISGAMLPMLFMFFLIGFSMFFVHQLEAMIAIGGLLIASFFLLSELPLLFNRMKKTKHLSCDLFFQPNFFVTTSFMLFIEISFLYWLKEAITYFEPYFLVFLGIYIVSFVIAELLLLCFSQRKALSLNDLYSKEQFEHHYLEKLRRQSFHKWQAIIDALIVAIFSLILLFVTLEIVFLLI